MESLVYIALFSPFVAALFAGLFFARSPKNIAVGVINSALIGISWLASVILAFHVVEHGAVPCNRNEWKWDKCQGEFEPITKFGFCLWDKG